MDAPPPGPKRKEEEGDGDAAMLRGTTLSVYRFVFREGRPVGPHDVQRGLGLSSASVASYHLAKLLEAGLIDEAAEGGYVVDRRVFENMIRVRRLLIPAQMSYVAFFATVIALLVTVLRPPVLYPAYYFSLAGLLGGLALSVLEARRSASGSL